MGEKYHQNKQQQKKTQKKHYKVGRKSRDKSGIVKGWMDLLKGVFAEGSDEGTSNTLEVKLITYFVEVYAIWIEFVRGRMGEASEC